MLISLVFARVWLESIDARRTQPRSQGPLEAESAQKEWHNARKREWRFNRTQMRVKTITFATLTCNITVVIQKLGLIPLRYLNQRIGLWTLNLPQGRNAP